MTEQEVGELINRRVSAILWKRIAIALAFLGIVNIAALYWLFHNIQTTARAVAADQAQQTAQKCTEEKVLAFTNLADFAKLRIQGLEKDFSDLYIEVGKSQERLAAFEEGKDTLTGQLNQLHSDYNKLNETIKGLQGGITNFEKPSPTRAQENPGRLNRNTGGLQGGSPDPSFGFPGDIYITSNNPAADYWVFSNGKTSAYTGGYWGLFGTNPDGSAGIQVSQGFPVEATQAGGALAPLLSSGLWDNNRKLAVDPLGYRLNNSAASSNPLIDWSGNQNSGAGLSFDGEGNPILSFPEYGTSLSEQKGNQNGNNLTFWASNDTWPLINVQSLHGNGSTSMGYRHNAGASGQEWASFIQGYGNMRWVQIEIGGSMLGSLLCESLLDNTTNQTSVDPCSYQLFNHNVSSNPLIDWSGNRNDNAVLSIDRSANTLFSKGLVLAATATPGSPAAGQIYFNTSDHHFYGFDGTAWKRLDH